MSNLKFDAEMREGATPSIPTNHHPVYKPPIWHINGPYTRKNDFRKHVIAYNGYESITISYARFLLECKLQRQLLDSEEAHHINELEFDDRIENLEAKDRTLHRKEHSKYKETEFICPLCQSKFVLSIRQMRDLTSKRKYNAIPGPFCSRSCAAIDRQKRRER